MNKKITFAIKALIMKEDRFLIVKRTQENPTVWELPGGHLEYGETAEDAIIREIQEEVSLSVKPVRVLDTWNAFLNDWQITGIIYLCEAEEYDVRLSDEHSDYRWVRYEDEDYQLLHKEFQRCLDNQNRKELIL